MDKETQFKKSFAYWCYEKQWTVAQAIDNAVATGCHGIELIDPKDWHLLKERGLECSLTASHLFVRGPVNKQYWDECSSKIIKAIDDTHDGGYTSPDNGVITFTGYGDTSLWGGSKVSYEEGQKNCIEFYKKMALHAEKKNVTLKLEMLNTTALTPGNSEDPEQTIFGHPGYHAENLECVADIIKQVGSPNFKMVFDVYHVQVMQGDLVENIKKYKELTTHVQIAGCPGRHEMGIDQEVNYKAVLQAFKDTGYTGYVTLEFLPTYDVRKGLEDSFKLFDLSELSQAQ